MSLATIPGLTGVLRVPSACVAMAIAAVLTIGCETQSLIDPSEVAGRPGRPTQPLMVPILDELAPGFEETDPMFAQAEAPRAEDMVAHAADYTIAPGDDLLISITDLVAPSVETLRQVRVSESGRVSLPLISPIRAEGMTEAQLQEAIAAAYRDADIIREAQVSVQVQVPRGKTFTIYGAVNQQAEYAIVKPDFRVMDALVLARGLTSPYINEFYIYRRVDQDNGAMEAPQQPPQPAPGEDVLAPRPAPQQQPPAETPAEAPEPGAAAPGEAPAPGAEGRYIIVDGKPVLVGAVPAQQEGQAPPAEQQQQAQPAQQPVPPRRAQQPADPGAFEFNELIEPGDVRVIRIDMESLRRGERRHNIVIRPGDMIHVPDPQFGFFYMSGHVTRPGTYQLSGQKTTVTQAIAAAGMLDLFAVASRTDVVRRVGDQNVMVRVDLKKIFNGTEPNFYVHPNDEIRVGTSAYAPFLAALRGAFRATYGFGFLYDRNYGSRGRDRGF